MTGTKSMGLYFIYISVSFTVMENLSTFEIEKSKNYTLAAAAKPFLGVIGFKIMALAALIQLLLQ